MSTASKLLGTLVVVVGLLAATMPDEAWGRAGGGFLGGMLFRSLAHIRQMDSRFDEVGFREWCSDAFFRIQAAWMRRDLEKLRRRMGRDHFLAVMLRTTSHPQALLATTG